MIITVLLAASLAVDINAPPTTAMVRPLALDNPQFDKVPVVLNGQFERPLLLQIEPVVLPSTENLSSHPSKL